jgi:glutathione S-transferase
MPVADAGGTGIGQSVAINFYVASECGLFGSSPLEGALILAVQEHLKECMSSFRAICPYGTTPTEEDLAKWFDSGATDAEGPADGANRPNRFLKWYLGRIEATLGEQFAVGGALSLADVLIYNAFAETLKPEERGEGFAEWRAEPYCSGAKMAAALAQCPKISASIAAVAANENVQKWLAMRGVQGF